MKIDWIHKICDTITSKIKVEDFLIYYKNQIEKHKATTGATFYANRKVRIDLMKFLSNQGVKNSEAVFFLHQCHMECYPEMRGECGCHPKIQ
jgi:hypothetical protein